MHYNITTKPTYLKASDCQLDQCISVMQDGIGNVDTPNSVAVEKHIPIYDAPTIESYLSDSNFRTSIMAEWNAILMHGAGVLVLKHAQRDLKAIDQASEIYQHIINQEKASQATGADHFAAAGCNDRIWNSLQKLCLHDPDNYIRYFSLPSVDAVAEAWLGPNYQMTAQVNLVRPGGKAQQVHRDYHLGFQTNEECERYPAYVHQLSPLLTLQGGISHCNMSVDHGPTKLLPYSQRYLPGYLAWRNPEFQEYFEQHYVQLPMEKGDAIFFNPALFHAAGENTSNDDRLVNLVQISSAFGRAMESIDRTAMCKALYQPLAKAFQQHQISTMTLNAVIATTAEGYPFPTNLDNNPPVAGLAPESQASYMRRAIANHMSPETFSQWLDSNKNTKLA